MTFKHRLSTAFIGPILLAALTLSACEPASAPLNPDTEATFGIYAVLLNADRSHATTLPAGMELGDDVQLFMDESGKPIFITQPPIVDESCLDSMEAITDHSGEPVLAFSLDDRCTRVFGAYTAKNIGSRMALMLNGEFMSAPYIHGAITAGAGLVGGNFSSLVEVEAVANSFN